MNRNKLKYLSNHWRLNWRRKPFITYLFLGIMAIMYFILTVNGGSQSVQTLVQFGAKYNILIFLGDWWRLITPTFLHIGSTHLIFNALVVYFLGSQIELIIGHTRYFLLFMLSAVMGNVTSFALNDAISAGASTAVFGLFASTLVLAKLYPRQMGIQQLSRNYTVLIILNVIFGLFSTTVDNAGHIGGLVGGYLIMYAISSPNAMNNTKTKQFTYAVIYLIVFIALLLYGYFRQRSFLM